MCNLPFTISLSWSVQGWNRLGHPLASQAPNTGPLLSQTSSYWPVQWKKEGCHKTKQIFTFSCSTVQYSHHPSLAKERERELQVRSRWDSHGTKERVATKHKYSPSCVVFTSPSSLWSVGIVSSTHSLLVEGTSLQVCSSSQYFCNRGNKHYNSTTNTHI